MVNLSNIMTAMFKKSPTGQTLPEEPLAYAVDALMNSSVFMQYNPDDLLTRKGYKIYKQMMTDEQVKAVVRFHRDAVTGRQWFFEDNKNLSDEENTKRRELMEAIIHKMKGSFKTRLDMVMSSLYNGFSLVEKTFELIEYEGKQWAGIKSLKLKPFETFYFNQDDFGDLQELEQHVAGHVANLDLTRFIHHVQNADVHEYYGQSELREAYRAWYSKDVTIKLQNIYLERAAAGFVWAKPVKGTTLTTQSKEYAALVNILSTIRSNSSILLPSSIELNVEHPNDTQAFDRAVVSHDKAIAKALLMPNLLGLSEQGPNGSRALGDTQLEAFLWMLDAEAGNLEEVVNEQLFQDLANLNFPDGLYPRWKQKELSNKQKMEIVDKWQSLVNGNAIKTTASDEAHLRSTLDFPESVVDKEESSPVDPDTALSGVQIASMMAVIAEVAAEKIPRATGIQILINSFPINEVTADLIMGEVGNGFEPKQNEPITPNNPTLPGGDEPDPDTTNEDGNPIVDSASNDENDISDETIVGKGGSQVITAKLSAAKNRVAFAVIDKKSTDIESNTIPKLSSSLTRVIKPVADDILTSEALNPEAIKNIKFDSKQIAKVQKVNKRFLTEAWMLGVKHAKDEINKANGKSMSVEFARLDTDAAEYFDSKSFTMTGKLTGDMLSIVQNILFQAIKTSASPRDTVDLIYETFAKQGFITEEDAQAEMEKILTAIEGGGTARLNTVIRTNSFEAINEARYGYFTDPGLDDFVEAMEYSSILDSRTTQICNHLDGHVHASEGEVWGGQWRPPNHFNCRSLLIPVTKFDKWSEDDTPSLLPQEGFR